MNRIGKKEHDISFTGDVGLSIDFLDVTVQLNATDGTITTKLFVKPTDASRYLHRRSDHGSHTFKSIPYSQFRRAVVICSNANDRSDAIKYMTEKFLNSGYKREEIDAAYEKVLKLNRNDILDAVINKPITPALDLTPNQRQLTFVVNRDKYMSSQIKGILRESQQDIDTLLGEQTRLIVAERRNNNIASLLFAKSSFSLSPTPAKDTQKCGKGHGCLTCRLMDLSPNVVIWKDHPTYRQTLKLNFRCVCTTEHVIYIYICKHCEGNDNFYVGQCVNSARDRANGHRSSFTKNNYKKSALSHHIYIAHPELMKDQLENFRLGVIKSTAPMNLDRLEDYYVISTKAELSLNRYKVVS